MSTGLSDKALADYLTTHTATLRAPWDSLGLAPRSLYPFTVCGTAKKHKFLSRIGEHIQAHAAIDPLDGTDHDLCQIADWIAPDDPGLCRYELALRFISLGTYFDVFDVDGETWDLTKRQPQGPVDIESCDRWIMDRVQRGETCSFRCKVNPLSEQTA